MKRASKEIIKEIHDDFDKVSNSADDLENVAMEIIKKYVITDRKDKNNKWSEIITKESFSDDYQSAVSLAVGRILRANKKK